MKPQSYAIHRVLKRGYTISQTERPCSDIVLGKFTEQISNIRFDIGTGVAQAVEEIICKYHDVFCLPEGPLPCVTGIEHEIKLDTDKPMTTPLYKHPLYMQ